VHWATAAAPGPNVMLNADQFGSNSYRRASLTGETKLDIGL